MVVVENRPGANGSIGIAEVQRAAPDGDTVFSATVGSMSINVSIHRHIPLDPIEDPASISVTSPLVWVVDPQGHAGRNPGAAEFGLQSGGDGCAACGDSGGPFGFMRAQREPWRAIARAADVAVRQRACFGACHGLAASPYRQARRGAVLNILVATGEREKSG